MCACIYKHYTYLPSSFIFFYNVYIIIFRCFDGNSCANTALTQTTFESHIKRLNKEKKDILQSHGNLDSRPAVKPLSAINSPSHTVSGIGLVVDLGFVEDESLARILSWANRYMVCFRFIKVMSFLCVQLNLVYAAYYLTL